MTKYVNNTKAPNLPIAPVGYEPLYFNQKSKIQREYFNQIDNFTRSINTATIIFGTTAYPLFSVNGINTAIGSAITALDGITIGGVTPANGTFTNLTATGLSATGAYSATFTDGIVIDYASGNGRVSVGTADTLSFYNGGIANTLLGFLPNIGSSGAIPSQQIAIQANNYTTPIGTANTLKQLFNVSTNGAVTVPSNSTWVFECQVRLTSLSSTSGDFQFGLLGTATIFKIGYIATASKSPNATPSTDYITSGTTVSAVSLVVANTVQAGYFFVRGTLTVTTGGTIIPAFALSIAAAAVVNQGSYFLIYPVGSNSVTTVGNWT